MELLTRDIVPLIDQSQRSLVAISRAARASRAKNPPPASLAEEKRLTPIHCSLRSRGWREGANLAPCGGRASYRRSQLYQPANGLGVNVYLVDKYS